MADLTSGSVDPRSLLTAEWPSIAGEVLLEATTEFVANKTWSTIRIDPEACDRWISILRTGGLVMRDIPYQELVDTSVIDAAEAVVGE
jgi:NitT/TauT family transport system substrate-binding protein